MKYINSVLIIICLCLAACSKSSEELESYIPQNSTWVAKINLENALSKGDFIDKNGNFSTPVDIKALLNDNDSFAKRIITTMASSGIKFNSSLFVFNSSQEFNFEVLAICDDASATSQWICQLTANSSLKQDKDYNYIFDKGTLYLIKDDVLFIGNSNKSDEKHLISEAKKLFENKDKTIADNKYAKEIIDKDSDISIYVSMTELNKQIQRGGKMKKLISKYPILSILTEMELKALAITVNLDKELKMDISISSNNNSGYSLLYSTILSNPSSDFVDIIPSSMETVFSISLKGKQLLNIGEFKKLLSPTATMPVIKDLDLNKSIATIDGPVAIGISSDADFVNEYNYIVILASNNPSLILSDINRVAHRYGQSATKSGNEYIYDYYNQKIKIGIKNSKYIYFKVLNDSYDTTGLKNSPKIKQFFNMSKIGFYTKLKSTNSVCELLIGSTSSAKISGQLSTISSTDNNKNIITFIINLICNIKPQTSFEEDNDIEYGGFQPIDNMTDM